MLEGLRRMSSDALLSAVPAPGPKAFAAPSPDLFDPHEHYPSQAGKPEPAPRRATTMTPLGPERYKVSFTASAQQMGKLERPLQKHVR